jgi:hypothetical protein
MYTTAYPPSWREVAPTRKQLDLLFNYGVSRTPQTKAEAYRLIEEMFNRNTTYEKRNTYPNR